MPSIYFNFQLFNLNENSLGWEVAICIEFYIFLFFLFQKYFLWYSQYIQNFFIQYVKLIMHLEITGGMVLFFGLNFFGTF